MKKLNIKTVRKILGICILATIVVLLFSIVIRNVKKSLDATKPISEMVGKTAKRNAIKVQDTNGQIFYLPKGFKISEDPTEQTVENGLVIIDDTGDEETNGSEFVWIPVDDIDLFNSNNGSSYNNLDSNYLKENVSTEQYIEMKNSVYKYGGFYISRYEAGISDKMKKKLDSSSTKKDTTKEFANGEYKPVSKANAIVWNNVQWGGSFDNKAFDTYAGNEQANGAVKASQNMYANNSKTSVKSSLCYGSQWDAVMNFIDSNYYNNLCEENSIIINSTGFGNYSSELKVTGFDDSFSQKNIFDLSGNVWEWTLEGFDSLYRVARGGSYSTSGDYYTICKSREFYPSDYYDELGFRVALYIE